MGLSAIRSDGPENRETVAADQTAIQNIDAMRGKHAAYLQTVGAIA
jgi:hypothetical protein